MVVALAPPACDTTEVVVFAFAPAWAAIEVVVLCDRTDVTVLLLAPAVAGMIQNIATAPVAIAATKSLLIVFSLIPPYPGTCSRATVYTL